MQELLRTWKETMLQLIPGIIKVNNFTITLRMLQIQETQLHKKLMLVLSQEWFGQVPPRLPLVSKVNMLLLGIVILKEMPMVLLQVPLNQLLLTNKMLELTAYNSILVIEPCQ